MVHRTSYKDGEPSWVDLSTPQLDSAKRFYGATLGWRYNDTGDDFGHYNFCLIGDGEAVAGLASPPPDTPTVPAAWNVYFASSNVDDSGRRIDQAGGKVTVGPMEIPDQGRMLFAQDPTGAAFGVWQSLGHVGAQRYAEPGAPCWVELNTREPGAADAFYRNVFGYEQEQVGDGEAFDYTAWRVPGNDQPSCGRLKMTEEWEGIPPHWTVYFAADDADVAAARAAETGGRVMQQPVDSPHGRIAVVADPAGAVSRLIDMSHATAS